jgi:hypothetical protein
MALGARCLFSDSPPSKTGSGLVNGFEVCAGGLRSAEASLSVRTQNR